MGADRGGEPGGGSDGDGAPGEPEPAPAPGAGPTGGARWRRPRAWRRRWQVLAGVVVVAVVLAAAELAFWVVTFSGVERFELEAAPDDGWTTYLLVGSDSRAFVSNDVDRTSFGDEGLFPGQRADLLVLVQVRPGEHSLVYSIPRDVVVDLPGGGQTRLALAFDDGEQALADAFCHGLGIGIDHMMVMGFDGLRTIVDAVGGITVEVAEARRDPMSGLDVPAGEVDLDGVAALAYVRARTGEVERGGRWIPDPDGAEGRQERAMDALAALSDEIGGLRWPSWGFHRVGRTGLHQVEMSESVGARDVVDLVRIVAETDHETEEWQRLGVDATQVGEVPMARPDRAGVFQLTSLGTYPAPCDEGTG